MGTVAFTLQLSGRLERHQSDRQVAAGTHLLINFDSVVSVPAMRFFRNNREPTWGCRDYATVSRYGWRQVESAGVDTA
jgi:hypothetical protein